MQLTFQWRCATCEYEDDANPGFCPGCGAPAGPPTLAETWNRDHPGDPMLAAARPRRVPRATTTWSRARRASARAPQRRWSPLAIASPVAGIQLGVTPWSTGVFDSGSSKPSTPASAAAKSHPIGRRRSTTPSSVARLKPPAANASLGAHRLFVGKVLLGRLSPRLDRAERRGGGPHGGPTRRSSLRAIHTRCCGSTSVTTGPATSDPITAAEPVIASVARERATASSA